MMNNDRQDAPGLFLGNPLISAKKLAILSGVSLEELRNTFAKIRNDSALQIKLDAWGPGDGYSIHVMREVLATPELVSAIYSGQSIYPRVLELHLGPACPCACIFCFSKGQSVLGSECDKYCPGPGSKLLSSDEVLSIVHELVNNGCNSIYFSGGLEPFSTKTTIDVLRRLPSEPEVRIYTNGVPETLTDDTLELIVQRASQIRFSIHAAKGATYSVVQMPHRHDGEETFLRVKNRITKAVLIQKNLLEKGLLAAQIGVTFLTVPANYLELEDAIKMWAEIGINFFDIGNDVFTEDPRTDELTADQISELKAGFSRIATLSRTGMLGKITVRPSRESIQSLLKPSAKKCYAPIYKAVIDPYGNRWVCCMRAHPVFQHGKYRVGGIIRNSVDFREFIEKQQEEPISRRELPLPWHCRECTEYEYTANICTEKLLDDLEFGISLSEQPFMPQSLSRKRLQADNI